MLSVKYIIKITKMSINACIHFLLILCKSKEFFFLQNAGYKSTHLE